MFRKEKSIFAHSSATIDSIKGKYIYLYLLQIAPNAIVFECAHVLSHCFIMDLSRYGFEIPVGVNLCLIYDSNAH